MRLKHFLSVFLTLLTLSVGQMWGATYTYDFTKGAQTAYWTSDNNNTSVGTSNIASFYYMQSGYSGHQFTAGNGSTSTHNHKFNTNNNQQCFFLGKTGEYLNLPTYSGEKITSVQIYGNTQGSSSANVNIYSGSTAASTASAIYDTNHSFSIGNNYQANALTVKVTNNYNCGITKIVITTQTNTPSYTITAQSNNTSYGTVSLSGSVITGSPKTNCRYASPAYSVSPANSATVSQNGNAFTVTPSANCTITINFEAIPKYTLNYHDGNGDGSKSNVLEGTNLIEALGTPAASCDATSTTFVGWTTSEVATKTDTKPTFVAADAVVNSTTAAAKYYAVYAKFNGGTISISGSDLISGLSSNGSYSSGSFTKQISSTNYTFNTYGSKQNTQIQMRASDAYVQIPTLPQKITNISCTACNNAGTSSYTGTLRLKSAFAAGTSTTNDLDTKALSDVTSFSWDISADASAGYLVTSAGLRLSNLSITYGVYKDYITTCCEPLAQINGSVDLNHLPS